MERYQITLSRGQVFAIANLLEKEFDKYRLREECGLAGEQRESVAIEWLAKPILEVRDRILDSIIAMKSASPEGGTDDAKES